MFSKGRTASTFVRSNWQPEAKTICLWRKLYPMGTQMLKHLSDVINLFFKCFSVDYDVINVRDTYVHVLSKTNKIVFHKMLKLGASISNPFKGHFTVKRTLPPNKTNRLCMFLRRQMTDKRL